MRALGRRRKPVTSEGRKRASRLARRLDELAERLAAKAHLVIIADEEGRLLYGNRLVHDRLQRRDDPDDVLARLHRILGDRSAPPLSQVPAAELSPTSPEGKRGAMVEIRRTVVHGEQNEVQAYIYLLRASDAKNLGQGASEKLNTLLPVVTLHAATALHDDGNRSASLARLDDLTDELERILA